MAGLVAVTTPSSLHAVDEVLCVTDVDPGPDPFCSGQPCSQVHSTMGDALDAAAALPDVAVLERPEVWICMGLELPDSGSPYEESLIVDNRGGVFGEPLSLILKRPWCPSPSSGPSQAAVEVVSDGDVFVRGPSIDMNSTGPCDSGPRPGVSFWGGGVFGHIDMLIDGWSGYGVANGVAGPPGELHVGEGAILNGQGAAVRSSTSVTINEMEIAGNETAGAVALLWVDTVDERLRLNDSAVYGNLAEPPAQALAIGSPLVVNNSAFIANATVGEVPLIATGAVFPDYAEDADSEGSFGGLRNTILSRNRSLLNPPPDVPAVEPGVYVDPGQSTCAAIPSQPYEDRPPPWGDLPSATLSVLVSVTGQRAESVEDDENLLFFVARSFFVANDHDVLLQVEAPGGQADVVLVHNTVADANGALLLELTGEPDTAIALIRNLYAGAPPDGVPVLVRSPSSSYVATMNAGPEGTDWGPGGQEVEHVLVGPNPPYTSVVFRPGSDLRSLDPCDRFAAVCADYEPGDCDELTGEYYTCLPDIAADYVPDSSTETEIALPWPWQTSWLGEPSVATAGATGWRCTEIPGTQDRWEDEGDADGFPDALDCENLDPDVIPGLPEHDGYSSKYCDDSEVDCFQCPEGSQPPPDADDDDSGIEESPGDGTLGTVGGEGCAGCGFGWSCDDGRLVLMALLFVPVLSRRRRA